MKFEIPRKKTPFLFLFLLLFSFLFLVSSAWGGTIVVPSIFVLHRPLNPALITRTTGTGFSYGGSVGNRDLLNSAPGNCQLKGYSDCVEDSSDSRFLYSSWEDTFYFQIENMALGKHEADKHDTYEVNFNQSEYDAILSLGLKTDFFSVGTYYRETELRLREYFRDINGSFSSKYETSTFTPGFGLHLQWGWLHLAYYSDGPTSPKTSDKEGRDFELPNVEGFRGGGIGMSFNLGGAEERPDEVNLEFFQLTTLSPLTGEAASLSGLDFEITLYSFVFYSLVLRDNHNNYFSGELLRDSDVSFATGIGWNGDWFQLLIGRDSRYFTGVDGGAQLVLGFQF
ncbi:MAG: hypothetical protein HQM13_07615 [SAR324 cluster bacterium]|nr:hypothetical protein [SAR324 cluster bacterium]